MEKPVLRPVFIAAALLALLALPVPASAVPVTLTFDELTNDELVTSQFAPAVTFANAIVSTWGVSLLTDLNPLPVSGLNVLSDRGPLGSPFIDVFFANPIVTLSGFFNYAERLTLTGFSGGVAVGSTQSLLDYNLLDPFLPDTSISNELITLTALTDPFEMVRISGVEFGGFTIDNLTFDDGLPPPGTPIPEPGTLGLMLLGGSSLLLRRRRTRVK